MERPRAGVVLVVSLLLLLLLVPLAEAAVPRQISISGLRTNTSGGAEKNFFHTNVNFTIFDSQAGGRVLDARQINVSTNTNGYWFANYSTAGFDTEVDMWLSINNTSPRLFLGPEPYSSQYLRRNETNSVNSSLTLVNAASILGFQSTGLVNSTHINASALGYAAIPVTATGVNLFSNLLSAASTFSGENTFSARQIFGNITLQQNLTHSIGGLLINITGGINASAVGFGSVPIGVLGNILSTAQTWTATQTFAAAQTFANITLQQNLTHSIGGLLINITGGINASAVGFGSIPIGVLGNILSTAQTWTAEQTFSARQIFGNITLQQNLTHSIGGILINQTGGINASAVGFGSIPTGVLPVFPEGAATPTGGLRAAFGRIRLAEVTGTYAQGLVNLSVGFTSAATYSVSAVAGNDTTGSIYSVMVKNLNGSQFNISTIVGASQPPTNITWLAIGY